MRRPSLASRSDEELLRDSQHDGAIDELLARVWPALIVHLEAHGVAADVQDLANQTVVRILQRRPRFRGRAAGSAAAWILSIADGVVRDAAARDRQETGAYDRYRLRELPRLPTGEEMPEGVADGLPDDVDPRRLGDALAELPRHQRDAVQARLVDEASYGEMAAREGTTELVMRQRVHAGRRALRELLRGRLGIGLPAVALVAGAVVVALVWRPILGDSRRGHPRASDATPVVQAARLQILRRPQAAADRGPLAQRALSLLDPRFGGVVTSGVRVVMAGRLPVVVVPVERRDGARDVTCLIVLDRPSTADGASTDCWTPDQVAGGDAVMSIEAPAPRSKAARWRDGRTVRRLAPSDPEVQVVGLVQDGPDRVEIRTAGGRRAFAVRSNLVTATMPRSRWGDGLSGLRLFAVT